MIVFAIDDEAVVLETLHNAVAEAEPGALIHDFRRGADALAAVAERGIHPDVVFTDIRMPDMDGLRLAAEIKTVLPDARIIFVTAYSQYALEAWKRHAHGFLMKPVTAEDVREALDHIPALPAPATDRLRVRCFGHFEVFWQGRPLAFARGRTKELFAYLVDREGAYCTAGELISALWEDGTEESSAKNYLRVLTNDLSNTLNAVGMRDVLLKRRGQWAVDCERLDCDFYRMRDGDVDAVNAYAGRYMVEYSWAEMTGARLYFRK